MLSFNTPWLVQNGKKLIKDRDRPRNNYLIIDNEKQYLSYDQSVDEIMPHQEYEVYQMWFLTDELVKNKEKIDIKLKDMALFVDNFYSEFDGGKYFGFDDEINLSMSTKNLKEFKNENDALKYRNLDITLEALKNNSILNIAKFSTNIAVKDYRDEELQYQIYYEIADQNGIVLENRHICTKEKIIYDNGYSKEIYQESLYTFEERKDKELNKATVNTTEYFVFEKNRDITELNITVYAYNCLQTKDENSPIYKILGKYNINLKDGKINLEKIDKNISKAMLKTKFKDINTTEKIVRFNSNNIKWEEYGIYEQVMSRLKGDIEYYGFLKLGARGQKTECSICNNYLEKDIDMENIVKVIYDDEQETNYEQYKYPEMGDNANFDSIEPYKIEKYTNVIQFKLAKIGGKYLLDSFENAFKNFDIQTDEQYRLLESKYNLSPTKFYYSIDKMIFMNGKNTSKEEYENNSRVKKIKVTINNEKEYIFDIEDTNKVQILNLDYKQGIEKPINVEIEVLEAYNGKKSKDIYISDILFNFSSNLE